MTRLAFVAALLLTACGGNAQDPGTGVVTEDANAPDSGGACNIYLLVGTFKAHHVERAGGTCGPIADAVVDINTTHVNGTSCGFGDSAKETSAGCQVTQVVRCTAPDGGGYSQEYAQVTPSGNGAWTGIYNVRMDGAHPCESVYDLTYSHQ
jgi:hypothetical protein